MTTENQLAALADATQSLLTEVNVKKTALDAAVETAVTAANRVENADALQILNDVEDAVAQVQQAKVDTQALRDAAAASANVVQSISAGLSSSAIPDPGYFSVPVSGDTSSFILYRKSAGVATEITRYPSAAGFVWFPPQSGLLGGWVTPSGRILLAFSSDDGRPIFGVGGDINAKFDSVFSQMTTIAANAPATGFPRSGFLHAWLTPSNRKLLWTDEQTGKVMVWDRDILTELDTAKSLSTSASATASSLNTRVTTVEATAPGSGYPRGGFLHAWLTPSGRKLMHSDDDTGRVKIWDRDVLAELDTALSGSQSTAQALAYIIPNTNVLAVGDSLTAGSTSWAATINTYTTVKNRSIINLAVGGQKSSHQSGRLGVVPFLITLQNNKILASGSSTVILSRQMKTDGTFDNVQPITNQGPTWKAKLMGVLGTFSSSTFDGSGNPTALVFTPDAGQITVDKFIDSDTPAESISGSGASMNLLLVGIGRNNSAEFDNVCRDLLAIRDRWQPTSYKRMIVVTPPPRWKNPSTGSVYGEGSGGAAVSTWNQLIAIERWCQATFGEYAVCSRQELMRNASSSADDQEAVANGSVPPSLTGDGLHWNTAGHAIIATAVASIINRKGF